MTKPETITAGAGLDLPAHRRPSKVRTARERMGLTQMQLATRIGRALSTVNFAERAPEAATPGVLKAIAEALGVQPEDLL